MKLADTSVWAWTRTVGGDLRAVFDQALIDGQIATCDMVRLQLLHSTLNATEFTTLRGELDALPNCQIGIEQWQRALDRIAVITGQEVHWVAPRGTLG